MKKRRIATLMLALVAVVTLTACAQMGNSKTKVTVGATASLREPLDKIIKDYEKTNPDVDIKINYGTSADVLSRTLNKTPADSLILANQSVAEQLKDKDIISETDNFLQNHLVLVEDRSSDLSADNLEDLLNNPQVKKIAIGIKTSALGQYTIDSLKKMDSFEQFESKLIIGDKENFIVQSLDEKTAQVGIVYQTDAFLNANKLRILRKIPDEWHEPVAYFTTVSNGSKVKEEAEDFNQYLASQTNQALFESYGYDALNS